MVEKLEPKIKLIIKVPAGEKVLEIEAETLALFKVTRVTEKDQNPENIVSSIQAEVIIKKKS